MNTIVRLTLAGIGMFCGYSVFIIFIILRNYPSAVLGFITGISESVLFILHNLIRKRRIYEWYSREHLRQIARMGIIIGLIGLLNLGYHTTIEIMYKKPIMPIDQSSVIAIIWSIIVTRSGITLLYYCVKYQDQDYVRLINGIAEEGTVVEGQSASQTESQ